MEGNRDGNTSFSDSEFDNELGDDKLRMKAVKERQQRWLVNQRNSKWLLENNKKMAPDGRPAIVAWALAKI